MESRTLYHQTYEVSSGGKGAIFGLGLLVAVGTLYVLGAASDTSRWAAAALIGAGVLAWAVYAAWIDVKWLAFLLVLEEMLPYLNILPLDPESGRWFLRLPLLFALAIPALPATWNSGLLNRGGFRLFALYFGWGAVTVVYSLQPVASGGRLLGDALEFLILLAIVASVEDEEDIQKVLGRFLMGCGLLEGLTLVAFFAFPKDLSWSQDWAGISRFSGISTTPNVLGELMLATVGAGFVHWRATPSRRRAPLAAAMILSVIFAALADSRSAFVALAVGSSAYVLWRYRFKGAVLILSFVVTAGIVYSSIGAADKIYFNRDVTTLTGRTYAWQFELDKVRQHPLLGYGYDVEGEIFQDRYFADWEIFWDRGVNTALHNSYLSVAVGLGVPALLFWLCIFVRPWIWLFRYKEDNWDLKPIFFFVIVPAVVLGFDETGLASPRYTKGIILFLCWMFAERRRLLAMTEVLLQGNSARSGPFSVTARTSEGRVYDLA